MSTQRLDHTNCDDKTVECSGSSNNKRKYDTMQMEGGGCDSGNNDEQEEEQSAWTIQYEIVKKVLQYLPIKDLLSASQTSKYWNEVGNVVRAKRCNSVTTILYHPYSEQGRTNEAVEYFNDVEISPEVNQLFHQIEPSFIEILDENWSIELLKEWETCFKRDFFRQFSEAQMILFFATKSFLHYIRLRKQRLSLKNEQESLFNPVTSRRIPMLSAFGCGVAASLPNNLGVFEMERTELPMITGLLIPKVSGLTVKVISFEKSIITEKYKRRKSVNSSNCMEILRISPEEKDKIKGIAILDADSYGRYTNPFMDAIFHYIKANPRTCVAGGNVHNTLTSISTEDSTKQLGFGLMICGDEKVKVGSVVMTDKGVTSANETKLKKFQSLISAGEGSFALMFACNGRGANMHHREHVEINLFKKHYPATPLIGLFTGGEVAHEYLPGESPQPPSSRSSLEYTFSTVFLFVSYKQSDHV